MDVIVKKKISELSESQETEGFYAVGSQEDAGTLKSKKVNLGKLQKKLVSGMNIKTVNSQSLLGSGDIQIETDVEWGDIEGSIADQTDLAEALGGKVDKVQGKGLSTNDYTTPEKTKLAGLENYDDTAVKQRLSIIEIKESGWDAKYDKPASGIPATDMAAAVRTSLGKADTALQAVPATYRPSADQDTIDNALSGRIGAIEAEIPSQASAENQLADKAFVNSSINALAAFYITADASGNAFATKAALLAGPYYSGGQVRVLTKNDYALVNADESHDGAACRYVYDGSIWAYQYKVNDTPFTAAQLAAINSGITAALVAEFAAKPTTAAMESAISAHHDSSKQDTINDLATIRSGAAAGATALQEVPNTYRPSAAQDVIDAGKQPVIDSDHKLSYSLLSGTPTIPSKTSDLTNDSGFITNTALGAYRTSAAQDVIDAELRADLDAIDVDNLGDVSTRGDARIKSIDLDELPKVCGFPMFVFGTAAPSTTPDFIGQFYIDTTNNKVYCATGVVNASSYKVLN